MRDEINEVMRDANILCVGGDNDTDVDIINNDTSMDIPLFIIFTINF
jgi:hypothetical protein